MFDRIVYISDRACDVKLSSNADKSFNIMNLHVIFEDESKRILGEVDDLKGDIAHIRFLGEITERGLVAGVIRKPTLDSKIRFITKAEVPLVTGRDKRGNMLLGKSPFYENKNVYMDVNGFFSNHFAIFGNSGSGKSCGVTRIFQNMFEDKRLFPYKSNIILFDSSGEYYNAFRNLSSINPNYNYRFISTNETDGLGEPLRIPIYLLNVDDMALLLNVNKHSQLPIVERMIKLARIFAEDKDRSEAFKNHLIAKAIMTILYTNETAPNKRNEIFSIIASCSTPEFSLDTEIKGIGYTRKFRDCFLIDQFGNFTESVLITEYIQSFIKEEFDKIEPQGDSYYDLETLEKALNFTLISEGWLRNENTYGDSVTIRVRLHSLITGDNAKYFDYKDYVTLEQFISSLLITNGKKYQLVNINLDDVDDTFAKVIVKIFSRLIFSFAKSLGERASIPFHLVVEEAHRYIQNDTDTFLMGYNIFDRIAKEGRKYGVILGLITQRPVEMSDTVISQCSNFLIFKMNHPADVDYIRKMVPNISEEIVEKQKTLQAGTCLAFGQAFKIPLIVKLEMPNPEPKSGNCDVVNIWDGNDESERVEDISDEEFVKEVEAEAQKEIKEEKSLGTISKERGEDLAPLVNKNAEESSGLTLGEESEDEEVDDVEDIESEDSADEEKEENSEEIDNSESEEKEETPETAKPKTVTTDLFSNLKKEVSEFNNKQGDNNTIPQTNMSEVSEINATSPIPDNIEEDSEESDEEKPSIANALSSDNEEKEESDNEEKEDDFEENIKNDQKENETDEVGKLVTDAEEKQESNDVMPTINTASGVADVPTVNVFASNVNVPENAENVSLNSTLNSQASITPDIKVSEEDKKPSIIIPAGQNVDPSFLKTFNQDVTIDNESGVTPNASVQTTAPIAPAVAPVQNTANTTVVQPAENAVPVQTVQPTVQNVQPSEAVSQPVVQNINPAPVAPAVAPPLQPQINVATQAVNPISSDAPLTPNINLDTNNNQQ